MRRQSIGPPGRPEIDDAARSRYRGGMSNRTPSLPASSLAALEQGNTIEAIKIVRMESGLGLKESKDLVDGYLKSRPDLRQRLEAAQAEAREGFVRWLVIFLLVAAAIAWFTTRGT
jgi:hypothetical protein